MADLALVLWLPATAALAYVTGLAGYRSGFLWSAVVVAGGGAATSAVVARRSRRRWLWVAAATITGIAAAGWLVDNAAPSRGRLVERLDHLELDGLRAVATSESGHSSCRPTCPAVSRTYRITVGRRGALFIVGFALVKSNLMKPAAFAGAPDTFSGGGDHISVTVQLDRRADGDRIVVRLKGHR